MFLRIVSGHSHPQSTGINFVRLHPYSATVFRRGVKIRRIITSLSCTAVVGQQFRQESKKLQTRIIFERYYFFIHYCPLSCRYVMLQKSILSKSKWEARPPCSDGSKPNKDRGPNP